MSSRPAEAYGIVERGEVQVGWWADLVLVNLKEWKRVNEKELLTKCGWSPFAGWNLTGWVHTTLVNGEIVYANGKVNPQVRGQALEFRD